MYILDKPVFSMHPDGTGCKLP